MSDQDHRPDTAARLTEIRKRHGDDIPCSMKHDDCFLLAEVDRLNAKVKRLEERLHGRRWEETFS